MAENYLLTNLNDTIEIKFSQNVNKNYKLFEVPKAFLQSMKHGSYIIGDETSDAVLCTSTNTYLIKKVETSNSIYLVPNSSQSNQSFVTSCHHEYYEVSQQIVSLFAINALTSLLTCRSLKLLQDSRN